MEVKWKWDGKKKNKKNYSSIGYRLKLDSSNDSLIKVMRKGCLGRR